MLQLSTKPYPPTKLLHTCYLLQIEGKSRRAQMSNLPCELQPIGKLYDLTATLYATPLCSIITDTNLHTSF